jgi:membrane protein DedA with SNARE-associated domain
MDVESVILASSYLGIFGLMAVNGFASIPSSQILYIIVGYFVSTGYLAFLPAAFLGALGNTIGNVAIYELTRRYGIEALKNFHIYREREVKKMELVFERKGVWFLFVGKLLPAIKIFMPIVAGLGKLRRDVFTIIMMFSSFLWALIFITIGYIFGKSTKVFQTYAFILLLVATTVVYLFWRYLNSEEILRMVEKTERS